MYIFSIVGSPRKGSNTDLLIDEVLKGAADAGAEVEKIYISDLKFAPCIGCMKCRADRVCRLAPDDVNMVVKKLDRADGIVLGAPVYSGHVPGQFKSLCDRLVGQVMKFDFTDGKANITSALTPKDRNGVAIGVCAASLPGMTDGVREFLKLNLAQHKNNGTIQEIIADGMVIPGQVNLEAEKLEKTFGARGQAIYENAQSLLKQAYEAGKNLVS
ncbi:flavodoxin family protein [Desulfosporosinus sp. OT]|uniref:flavodoxin family protein n=1 Tax=Desulfosporosinus sp. OT TaxID=913865 RepID=UPI000223B24E|nr:flavodoxin family protein [Desulfosporosinus sp. OT]EGW38814.1 NADPH-dependent FMN reductase family protein [Desulfosporosinus sp. OT]